MKILHVVGARPNYMKVAPIMLQMDKHPDQFEQILIHTGQHYDANMSDVFFEDLSLKSPDYFLGVGSGSHSYQTARIMLAFEPIAQETQPDLTLVVGDVNSTLACALVCAKLGIPIAHVEAGLRAFDRTMPEEINRILTDQISDVLFTPSIEAETNLLREGISSNKIHFVGNVMIDTLVQLLPLAAQRWQHWENQLGDHPFALVTLHRPSNVDNPQQLQKIVSGLVELSQSIQIVFPVHPRTKQRLDISGTDLGENISLMDPLGYLDFLALESHAALVITDSGGVQEETTYLGRPCLTIRPNTERPITITHGTNQLVEVENLVARSQETMASSTKMMRPPDLWDGQTAQRIVKTILESYA